MVTVSRFQHFWPSVAAWSSLIIILAGIFWVVLGACGLQAFGSSVFTHHCEASKLDSSLNSLRNSILENEIRRLEMELLHRPACVPTPGPTTAIQPPVTPPEFMPDSAWKRQDVSYQRRVKGSNEGIWLPF